jgi:pentose-5-phosphate-3-epimerase
MYIYDVFIIVWYSYDIHMMINNIEKWFRVFVDIFIINKINLKKKLIS